jgi:ubiquinone/menaquinone biosynthesis C-methylase UbiE
MDKSTRFWDRVAERYSKRPVSDEAVYEKKLQVTREYLKPEMALLEFGCGTGSTAIAHAPFVRHIRAIDSSSKMIEIARGKAVAGNVGNVTFEQSSIEQLTVPGESLDGVLALSVLHLLDNRETVIDRVYKILKTGGIFVTSTICIGDSMKLLRYILPIAHFFGLVPKINTFTANDLKTSLTDAGFGIDYLWQPGKGKTTFIIARKGIKT